MSPFVKKTYVKYQNCLFLLQTKLLAITFERAVPDIFREYKILKLK